MTRLPPQRRASACPATAHGTQNLSRHPGRMEAPLPLALARWQVGGLAHWHVGEGSESKRHRKFGQEVGELETETWQGWGGKTRPRHTRRLAHRGPDLAEKQGSGCISGQLQGPTLEQHLQAATGPHGTAGPGWTPRAPFCGPLGPERADWRWAVSETGSAFCASCVMAERRCDGCDGCDRPAGLAHPPSATFCCDLTGLRCRPRQHVKRGRCGLRASIAAVRSRSGFGGGGVYSACILDFFS